MTTDLFGEAVPPSRGSDRPIRGEPVPPLVPAAAAIHTVLCGEAPGRWGADASGVPFLGDVAGTHLMRALIAAGAATWPGPPESMRWDGTQLAAARITPIVMGVMLTNAFDRCPADPRVPGRTKIRPPTPGELRATENLVRLRAELALAHGRGLRQVVTMGRVAEAVLAPLVGELDGVALIPLPHPSAQGLLTAAPRLIAGAPAGGKGCTLAALAAAWEAALARAVARGAGRGAP